MSSPEEDPSQEPESGGKRSMDWMTTVFPIVILVIVVLLLVYSNLVRSGFFR
jgi:heme/copper-type cytochrome/quinol oxidase subunit 2